MPACGPTALLAIVLLITVAVACTGARTSPPSETAVADIITEPTAAEDTIDGATWILETVDRQPPIAGTYLTLTISGSQFGGFDGCNSFGGRHQSGTPVVKPDGTISVPPFGGTDAGCPTDAVVDQANRYLEVMTQEARARVVDDRLHIIDSSGAVALVFARQTPLAGRPIDLVGTSWRLVDRDGIYGKRPTTVVFLSDHAAVGTAACRDYAVGYTSNAGRIRIPDLGMAGSAETCSRDAIDREQLFTEDFGWANEYSTSYVQGALRSLRLVVRTSRGKTLIFRPLPQLPGAISDERWTFIRSLESRSDRPGMRWVEDTDTAPGSEITAVFDEKTVEGLLRCHRYAYYATGGEGTTLVSIDGSMSMSEATLSTNNTCDGQAGISPQQRHYLDLLGSAERYHVLGDRLVIRTNTGDALMFRAGDGPLPTRPAPAGVNYSMKDLEAWLVAVEGAAGPGSGIFMTSIDERNKRIQIRMRPLRGALEQMEAAIAKVDVPREAVVVEIGCDTDALSRLDQSKSPEQAFHAAISYSLEAPSQVAYGKTVGMTLTLRNISDEPVQVPHGRYTCPRLRNRDRRWREHLALAVWANHPGRYGRRNPGTGRGAGIGRPVGAGE